MDSFVRLQGDDLDLRILAELYDGTVHRIFHEGDRWYLDSPKLQGIKDQRLLEDTAQELVNILVGAAQLRHGVKPVQVGAVCTRRQDGTIESIVLGQVHMSMEFRGFIKATKVLADGTVAVAPRSEEAEWIEAIEQDDRLPLVLHYLRKPLEWVELYNLVDLMEEEDKTWIETTQPVSIKELGRFKGTACNMRALGEKARHGTLRYKMPSQPMTLSEARKLIGSLAESWIRYRVRKAKGRKP